MKGLPMLLAGIAPPHALAKLLQVANEWLLQLSILVPPVLSNTRPCRLAASALTHTHIACGRQRIEWTFNL